MITADIRGWLRLVTTCHTMVAPPDAYNCCKMVAPSGDHCYTLCIQAPSTVLLCKGIFKYDIFIYTGMAN